MPAFYSSVNASGFLQGRTHATQQQFAELKPAALQSKEPTAATAAAANTLHPAGSILPPAFSHVTSSLHAANLYKHNTNGSSCTDNQHALTPSLNTHLTLT
jgi:hypothetical protein